LQIDVERPHEGRFGARAQRGVAVRKLGQVCGEPACRVRRGAALLTCGIEQRLRCVSQRRDVFGIGRCGAALRRELRI
jgi:hypothetical protein